MHENGTKLDEAKNEAKQTRKCQTQKAHYISTTKIKARNENDIKAIKLAQYNQRTYQT